MNSQPSLFDTPDPTAYYNTTSLKNEELKESVQDAKKQDDIILALYHKHGNLSPSMVFKRLNCKYPITSIRRSINTLTNNLQLEKLSIMAKGMYGKPEHIWKFKKKNDN